MSKWDECIQHAPNGMIYSTSFYLNAMCKWNALVLNDYEAVMPVPFKIKWGITYVYQPAFIQQLGIMSSTKLTAETTNTFLEAMRSNYRFAEVPLNHLNIVELNVNYQFVQRKNYIKSLTKKESGFEHSDPYLIQRYSRAAKNDLIYSSSDEHEKVIALYEKLYNDQINFNSADYKNFNSICEKLKIDQQVFTRICRKDDEIVAAVILLQHKDRLYNLVSCLTESGRKLKANYFLYGKVIEEFSGRPLILDLEGSDNPGIAYFYNKIADMNQDYPFIKYNSLPKLIRLLKS